MALIKRLLRSRKKEPEKIPQVTPEQRSMSLLMSLLPKEQRESFKHDRLVRVRGSVSGHTYIIAPSGGHTRNQENGQRYCILFAGEMCTLPCWDRVIAEYLLIKSDEQGYLNIACKN